MPYFLATSTRALQRVQTGKQARAQQHPAQLPNPAFSMAEPKTQAPPQYSLQQQPMPQSLTSQQPQRPDSHVASDILATYLIRRPGTAFVQIEDKGFLIEL